MRLVSIPAINFLTLFIGIKFYGKEHWGEFISISIWIYFVAFVAKWAGQNYLIKEFSKNPAQIMTLFYANFLDRSFFMIMALGFFWFFPFSNALAATTLLFTLFLYNSFDALIVFYQKFKQQLIAEIIGFLFLVGCMWYCKEFNLNAILYAFSVSFLIRIGMLLFYLKLPFQKIKFRISIPNLIETVPFFLIGFSGWLASKIDLYVVNYFFSKEKLSEYQLLITCFLLLQSFAGYLILPFSKHFFRLPKKSIVKIKRKIGLLAIPFICVSTFFIWIGLEKIVGLNFSISFYIIGALSSIPSFYYAVDMQQLYRKNKEKKIVRFSFIGAGINLILMVLLIPIFDVLGVLLSILILQWLYLFVIKTELKK